MGSKLKNSLRFFLVTIGIVVLTSFGIDATDTLRGSQSALGIFANKITEGKCPPEMVLVEAGDHNFCIDKYEVSVGEGCEVLDPTSVLDTAKNSNQSDCLPVSKPEAQPWTYVAKPQAEQLCARSGKRLPTAKEWQLAVLGTPDNFSSCNLAGKLAKTGGWSGCVSGAGVHDMVGNVWEFVEEEVENNRFDERDLPDEGYVDQVESDGLPSRTSDRPNPIYNNDYFWIEPEGRRVVMRGGFYGSKEDGGIYATHAEIDSNFASAAIGFRCAKLLP